MNSSTLDSIPNGARFRRADLHIHSLGGSFDVEDPLMTPGAIVDAAIAEGLELIALTDHNSVDNVELAIAHVKDRPLFVVPAVELTTTQGHLLVYMPTVESLRAMMGRLTFSAKRDYLTNGLEQCLDLAASLGGFGVAAHIDVDAGFDRKIPGSTPVKAGFVKHPALLGLEIKRTAALHWYTSADTDSGRSRIAKERREALGLSDDLPKIMSSDAHTLAVLGRNAAGNSRVTRLKMDEPTFEGLRIALTEGAVRCRLEEEVPANIPRILGIHFQGGFLDDQTIHFSSNLTCVIGGRGTGKSTALESVRAATGNDARESLVDSEAGADTVTLWYRDETGAVHALVRSKGEDVYCAEGADGPTHAPIEGYGQGETAETIQHCGKDPQILLAFLDRFVDLESAREVEKDLLAAMRTKADSIARLAEDVKSLRRYKELLVDATRKIATLKKQKATEIIELEEALAKEKLYCAGFEERLGSLTSGSRLKVDILEYVGDIDDAVIRVGKKELAGIRLACKTLEKALAACSDESKKKGAEFAKQVRTHLEIWRAKETEERAKIEAKRKELAEAGVKLDMVFVRKVTANAAAYEKKIRELEQKSVVLKQTRVERKKLVEQRFSLRTQIFTKRAASAAVMNKNLEAGADDDFGVTLRYREATLSADCERIVTEAMAWRTSRVPRAEMLITQMGVPSLLLALEKKDTKALGAVKDDVGTPVFSTTDRDQLVDTLSAEPLRHLIEECAFDDLPAINVRGSVVLPDGSTKVHVREFSKLSLGQQQSIVLSMLLFSESQDPLVIDQPEDNLDSLFIAKVLVANLRKVKERRQVIVVTHNPNIAVLSDTELIISLRATSDRAVIGDRGSIDAAVTQRHLCRILEGGESAFRKRAQIYGSVVS